MWLFSILCSVVADKLISKTVMKETKIRKLFNSIGIMLLRFNIILTWNYEMICIYMYIVGQYGPAIALLGVGYVGCNTELAVMLLTLAVGLSGACFSGFQVDYINILPFWK